MLLRVMMLKRQERPQRTEIKIPRLTFMNCSIALEASELERNKVFGSAGGAEQKRLYFDRLQREIRQNSATAQTGTQTLS